MERYLNKHESKKHIEQLDKGFIDYQGKQYFFKRCNDDLCYREIIAYEVANFLGIHSIFYRVALIPSSSNHNDLGVISENYKNKNLFYIDGQTILKDYHYGYLKDWQKSNNYQNNYSFNTLDSIWNALDFRYRFLENRSEVVSQLLNAIIANMFLFDIFMKNADRHFNNWEVAEDLETNEVKLSPLYDNEDIFLGDNPRMCNITMDSFDRGNDWYDLLRQFLNVSDGEYLVIVNGFYNRLTPKTLVDLIELAEKRHNINIPISTKKEIITKYVNHYAKIGQVLKEFNERLKRILILK